MKISCCSIITLSEGKVQNKHRRPCIILLIWLETKLIAQNIIHTCMARGKICDWWVTIAYTYISEPDFVAVSGY